MLTPAQTWQKVLDASEFRFDESKASILYSLSQYTGNCTVHITRAPKQYSLTLTFERDGKKILSLPAYEQTTFRVRGDILYFAHYNNGSSGCKVAAYNLLTGNILWESDLLAMGPVWHSAYNNQVTLSLGILEEGKEGVVITGHESYGDYQEVLDCATGKRLAHRIYCRR